MCVCFSMHMHAYAHISTHIHAYMQLIMESSEMQLKLTCMLCHLCAFELAS